MALYTGGIITAIITFATLIIVCTTPWVVIMTIGYIARRGFYRSDDLQVFNRGQKGGSYCSAAATTGADWARGSERRCWASRS